MTEVKDSPRNGDAERKDQTSTKNQSSALKRIGIYAAILVAVFLLGLIPMWLSARERSSERDAAQRSLRVSQMQNRLASAAIDARRGEYEQAREAASDFFTNLRTEVDRPQDRALTSGQNMRAETILATRDDIITLLARNDPASVDRLSDAYVAYREGFGNAQTASNVASQR